EVRTAEDKRRSFTHQRLPGKVFIVAAGPGFNFLLAYLIFTGWLATGAPLFVPTFKDLTPDVEALRPGSPAELAGLQDGDRVVSIEGQAIATWSQMTGFVKESPNRPLRFEVKRDGRLLTLTVTPAAEKIVVDGKPVEVGKIGISGPGRSIIRSSNPLLAAFHGLQATWGWTELTAVGIYKMLTGEISSKN